MEKRNWKFILLGLGTMSLVFVLLFTAVRLPFMHVVRNNIQTGVDADAYFYSEVENFQQYEKAVRERNETVHRR